MHLTQSDEPLSHKPRVKSIDSLKRSTCYIKSEFNNPMTPSKMPKIKTTAA